MCRVLDTAAIQYVSYLQSRSVELDRLVSVRGRYPEEGYEDWWLSLHPLSGDVLKDLQNAFNSLPDAQVKATPDAIAGRLGCCRCWCLQVSSLRGCGSHPHLLTQISIIVLLISDSSAH